MVVNVNYQWKYYIRQKKKGEIIFWVHYFLLVYKQKGEIDIDYILFFVLSC